MDEMTQQNASLVEEAAAASEAMGAQAEELDSLVEYFRLYGHENVQQTPAALREPEKEASRMAEPKQKPQAQKTLPQVLPEDVADDSDWQEF
ncbi:MAG: hypothetical protein HY356_08270 [Gammaproteobacteria bacterium]|nr:hypothetical protein [Gammaproteobacteria bacterium]